jgi:hypothetical protein
MNDTPLVFIEACPDCGRVQRVSSKRRAPRKTAALCPDCVAAQREHASSAAEAEGGNQRQS